MAHRSILRQGTHIWNDWRAANITIRPNLRKMDFREEDLRKANLGGADLRQADLRRADLQHAYLGGASLGWADLRQANLSGAKVVDANLQRANLYKADLVQANLYKANLREADLREANLCGANLGRADLRQANLSMANASGADLSGADLSLAILIRSKLQGADLNRCRIYGVSVWDASLETAIQRDLIITPEDQPEITVDNIEVAQFVYLLLNNAKIRDVIDTITSKAVLILGSFRPERKRTLDALRDALRNRNYLPIVFDFEKPRNRDFTETVSTLAHLARFVIADLTDPRSIPQELTAIIPRLLSVPVRPLLLGTQREWGMFPDLRRYPQVIEPLYYADDGTLLAAFETEVIASAEQRARELVGT